MDVVSSGRLNGPRATGRLRTLSRYRSALQTALAVPGLLGSDEERAEFQRASRPAPRLLCPVHQHQDAGRRDVAYLEVRHAVARAHGNA